MWEVICEKKSEIFRVVFFLLMQTFFTKTLKKCLHQQKDILWLKIKLLRGLMFRLRGKQPQLRG